MPTTFPPTSATLVNDVETTNRFLQHPEYVARAMQSLAEFRYIGTRLLKGRAETSGGSIGYEEVEGIFADDTPKTVAPGSEYPVTTTGDGTAQLAKVTKSGEDTIITDESIKRRKMDAATRAMTKLVNSVAKQLDQTVISVVASSVTQNNTAIAQWDNLVTAKILRDILLAKAKVTSANLGYTPDILLVDDLAAAYLASDPTIAAAMARETRDTPVYTGFLGRLANLDVVNVPAENLPGGVAANAWVLDSNALGFIAFENLGGGYQSAGDLIESKVMRQDLTDGWRLRGRSNFVPVVTDPKAGCRISGVAA